MWAWPRRRESSLATEQYDDGLSFRWIAPVARSCFPKFPAIPFSLPGSKQYFTSLQTWYQRSNPGELVEWCCVCKREESVHQTLQLISIKSDISQFATPAFPRRGWWWQHPVWPAATMRENIPCLIRSRWILCRVQLLRRDDTRKYTALRSIVNCMPFDDARWTYLATKHHSHLIGSIWFLELPRSMSTSQQLHHRDVDLSHCGKKIDSTLLGSGIKPLQVILPLHYYFHSKKVYSTTSVSLVFHALSPLTEQYWEKTSAGSVCTSCLISWLCRSSVPGIYSVRMSSCSALQTRLDPDQPAWFGTNWSTTVCRFNKSPKLSAHQKEHSFRFFLTPSSCILGAIHDGCECVETPSAITSLFKCVSALLLMSVELLSKGSYRDLVEKVRSTRWA